MPLSRRFEFHDSTLIAVRCDASCARIDLDGCIQRWEGTGALRLGTGWVQRVHLEIDFPDVDQGIAVLPATLWSGTVASDAIPEERSGGLSVPASVEGMIVLELVATSGEILRIGGERLRTAASGEARFVKELPGDMDPER